MVEEETKPVTPEAPPVEPPQEPTEPLYTCSHCSANVVPEEHDTPTGKVHRCPKCGKFMKLETPEEVKVREEEARGPLPPLNVLLTERIKELLVKELPAVYGIPKKDASKTITAIIDTLTPAQATDPWNLHSHIKDFASNANDRHLESIINKIFSDLEEEGYLPKGEEYQPRYGQRRPRGGYQPRYARREARSRYGYGYEDYGDEDYPPRRRRNPRMTVVMDGQEIETDYEGYLAHQRYKREQGEEKRNQQEHELRMKRIEAEILKITAETGGSKTPPAGPHQEVREFLDAEGNLCDPEKAVSIRIKTIPIETKGLDAEEVRRIIREEKEQLTPEKVREIVRSEKPAESEEVKALRGELNESRKSIEDLRGAIEAKDRQALLDKISGLEGRVSDLAATGTGEWKSDEIRLIKGSISDIKDLLQTYLDSERPLDRAERILTGGAPGARPSSEMAGETERGGVIKTLREHGLVTKIVERVRG